MIKPSVSIIGYGRLGQNFCRWLLHSGFRLEGVFNRSTMPMHPELFQAAVQGTFPESRRQLGDITLICVKDDAIRHIAERLQHLDLSGTVIAHTSGAIPAEELALLRSAGASVASVHPMQTFAHLGKKNPFRNIGMSLEGDRHATDQLAALVRGLGANPLLTDARGKAMMHLACVWVSNYLHVLMDSAVTVGKMAGVSNAQTLQALQPLIAQSLTNAYEQNPEKALTGPASRADIGTVNRHLNMMQTMPELQQLYGELAAVAAGISFRRGSLSAEETSKFTDHVREVVKNGKPNG